MGSFSPPPPPSLPPHRLKKAYSLTPFYLLSFLVLLLVSIFFFSRNALEPTLSFHSDYLIWSSANPTPTFNPTTTTTTTNNNNNQSPPPPPPLAQIDPETEQDNGVESNEFSIQENISSTIQTYPIDLKAEQDNGMESNEDSTQENISSTIQINPIDLEAEQDNGVESNEVSTQENISIPDPNDGNKQGDIFDEAEKMKLRNCDLYTGTWVKDDDYPVYQPGSCPYVDESYNCQDNGRLDSDYTKWKWKPHGCDLPRFNATDFLERLRGKKLMLVGDSMNRNQFESILCLLRDGLPNKSRMYETHGYKITKGRGYYIFKFEDYDCTVDFVRSHFLVREGIRLNAQRQSNPTLSIDRIDKSAPRWKRADILVFNTGHWWTHGKTARGTKYYKEGDFVYPKFDAIEAYSRAMKTWGKWVDKNIDPAKKLVIYRGYSSAHFRGGDWDSGGTCNGEKEPILKGAFLDTYPPKMKIVQEVIGAMRVPVVLLNVTRLTNFRKDGHPSIYGKNRTQGQKVSTRRQDCSHWCLPGVPDAWNELIYVNLIIQQITSSNQK